MQIIEDDLNGNEIRALITFHVQEARANSPPGHSFALDVAALKSPDMTFWSAWDGEALMGCCALKELSTTHGEIKSMRTSPEHLRKGVAQALLEHIIQVGRSRGFERISLETGAEPAYSPALALYQRMGFVMGAAFADYEITEFNQCFHLEL